MSPRLRDHIAPNLRVLFVGINPGLRSAETGHHFAGYSNRFWKLMHESGLVSEPIGHLDDGRLPEWGYGITNLVARPTSGIEELRPAEYQAGRRALLSKIARAKPEIVAFVGVTLYRAIFPQPRMARGPRVVPSVSSRSRFTALACSCCRIQAAAMRISRTARCWPPSRRCAMRWTTRRWYNDPLSPVFAILSGGL